MPSAPQILPTQIQQGTAPGVTLPARGRARPGAAHGARRPGPGLLRAPRAAVEVPAAADRPASAEKGLKRRVFGGMPLLLLEAQSAGEIAFSRDAPGHIVALHLQAGEGIIVREHQFLAATGGVAVRLQPDQGLRQHALRRRLLGRPVLRRRPRGRRLGPRLRQRVREDARAGRDDRHRARRLGLPRPLGPDDPGGLRLQDRLPRRRPATSSSTASPAPAASGCRAPTSIRRCQECGGGSDQQRQAAAGCSAASSAACSTTSPRRPMSFAPGHLADHPLPPGIVGALGLGGYQLLVDVAGVGAGRLGPQAFLLVAPDPDPSLPDAGTQISLHQPRLKDEREACRVHPARRPARLPAPVGLPARARAPRPAQQGQRRQPRDRRDRGHDPRQAPAAGCSAAVANAASLLATVRALPPAGPPPDLQSPELLRQVLLALALRDESSAAPRRPSSPTARSS